MQAKTRSDHEEVAFSSGKANQAGQLHRDASRDDVSRANAHNPIGTSA